MTNVEIANELAKRIMRPTVTFPKTDGTRPYMPFHGVSFDTIRDGVGRGYLKIRVHWDNNPKINTRTEIVASAQFTSESGIDKLADQVKKAAAIRIKQLTLL